MCDANPTDDFCRDLTGLINSYSLENGSDTPDFILSDFLVAVLKSFNKATVQRHKWGNDGTPKLIAAVSKMMLCFPEVIEEGSIDEDFTLPHLIVEEVRKAMKPFEDTPDDH